MPSERVRALKAAMLAEKRVLSCEQARIVTRANREHRGEAEPLVRAWELRQALREMTIEILPGELLVGNRAPGVRAGVVYPRCGLLWVDGELESLPTRTQDPFEVRPADARAYRQKILPYWKGNTLEERIAAKVGGVDQAIRTVVKVNQQGRAQGHIIPDIPAWLRLGPAGLLEKARQSLRGASGQQRIFYQSVAVALEGAQEFLLRYAALARQKAGQDPELARVARVCEALAERPASGYREALQSVWFLLVLLHMESNAMSFSLGRADQYLLPYYEADLRQGRLTEAEALELTECFYLKCNQIVCMCDRLESQYFAGFPIGFNLVVGGGDGRGNALENPLTFLLLKAQRELHLPQPNLSARVCAASSEEYLEACAAVVGQGGGMPQFFGDETVIPALTAGGMALADAADYGVVGCVELSGCGDTLAWSNAAMFNLLKVMELALNGGRCLLTGRQLAPDEGDLARYESYEQFEAALEKQMDYFIERMVQVHEEVDRQHAAHLASPLLSSVVKGCLERGVDVTAGGAKYNRSGIQLVQVADLADSLAVLKYLVFPGRVSRAALLDQLRRNWPDETLRRLVAEGAPHYGNDDPRVDGLANKWIERFAERLAGRRNVRGGSYTVGLYTVSAHVPMGANVGAACTGRRAGEPLADGGVSPRAGCDVKGPTAVLKSVAALPVGRCANGTLLNMKFSRSMFERPGNRQRFVALLRAFCRLPIDHVQFNVVDRAELLAARRDPAAHRNLIVRVAGYSAYFVELDGGLQSEIIRRTECVM